MASSKLNHTQPKSQQLTVSDVRASANKKTGSNTNQLRQWEVELEEIIKRSMCLSLMKIAECIQLLVMAGSLHKCASCSAGSSSSSTPAVFDNSLFEVYHLENPIQSIAGMHGLHVMSEKLECDFISLFYGNINDDSQGCQQQLHDVKVASISNEQGNQCRVYACSRPFGNFTGIDGEEEYDSTKTAMNSSNVIFLQINLGRLYLSHICRDAPKSFLNFLCFHETRIM